MSFLGAQNSIALGVQGIIAIDTGTGAPAVITDPYWPYVSMLLHGDGTNAAQNNTFLDGSTNNFTVTRNGNTTQGSFNPFVSTYPYAVATNGGSAYFDGTGDYLTVPDSTAFTLGTNDFTIECWVNFSSLASTPFFMGQGSAGFSTAWYMGVSSAGVLSSSFTSSVPSNVTITSGASAVTINTWYHIAIVRNGTTGRQYINGVQNGTSSFSGFTVIDSPDVIGVGAGGAYTGNPFTGYISNFRLVNGTCLYPSGTTFTPPTAPLTAVTNTALLLGMSNGAIYDNAELNNLETTNNFQISTGTFKYGTGSLYSGSFGSLVTSPANQAAFAFGSGDFTIEMWINPTVIGTAQKILYDGRLGVDGTFPTIYADASSRLIYFVNAAVQITGGTISTGAWVHIAICRSGTSTKMFISGTQSGSTYTDSTVYTNNALRPVIGAGGPGGAYWQGYIDDLRVTKGIARYTANFTPPTAAFPNS